MRMEQNSTRTLLPSLMRQRSLHSLMANADHWAERLPRASHPPAVSAWKSEPDCLEKFTLIKVFEDKLLAQIQKGEKLVDQYLPYTQGTSQAKSAAGAVASGDPYGSAEPHHISPYDDEPQPVENIQEVPLMRRLALKQASLTQQSTHTRVEKEGTRSTASLTLKRKAQISLPFNEQKDIFCIASDDETSEHDAEELYRDFNKDAAKRCTMSEVNNMLNTIPERTGRRAKNDGKTTAIGIVQHYHIFV